MTDVNIFVAFAAGVFSFLSPCVLPLIPSYLSFVSGVSLDEMRSEQARARVRWRVILNSAAFIIGFSLVLCGQGKRYVFDLVSPVLGSVDLRGPISSKAKAVK